jgi:beta-galactosidase
LQVDASAPIPEAQPVAAVPGTYRSANGETLSMNSRYLMLNGRPWLPVMGEFHYSRVPEADWEDEILKMKAGGVQIISVYVIWIHQEEVKGQFDWDGRRDLRHFVELCAKHHMYVYVRIGPWTHGESRNGGFPDWLLAEVKHPRTTDPLFLSYVKTYYDQIGRQLRGLLWSEGGPVMGVQLSNEYSMRGPGAGDDYILALKKLAIEAGMRVPIYSVTGWDNAVVPKGAVVAMYGGYPDGPWSAGTHQLPPQEVYAFRFGSRVSGDMGAMGASKGARDKSNHYDYPFMTTEVGGGIEDTYHRRPVIEPDDIAAMMPVMLGSGANLYGTYMFQGGENPDGKLTTLQESQATGYPTDVPVKSYDFQAPLSEFGEEREVFRKLKVFNYFLNDFGDLLAPMAVFAPKETPASPADLSVPRIAVRTNGEAGFVFFNNYVRYEAMPERRDFQVRIKLAKESIRVPSDPVTMGSNAYGIWPFNLRLGGIFLRYATAQLFTKTQDRQTTTFYFVATPGVRPEFLLRAVPGAHLAAAAALSHRGEFAVANGLRPSLAAVVSATDANGATSRIVLISQRDAENMWKLRPAKMTRLWLTPQQFFADEQEATLQQDGEPAFSLAFTPAIAEAPRASVPLQPASAEQNETSFTASLPQQHPKMSYTLVKPAGQVPPVELGPALAWRPQGVAMAPREAEFARAAKWKIQIDAGDWKGIDDLFLEINYDGDVARLISGGELLDDNFYNGEPWRVGLNRFRSQIERNGLELEILPRRADAPIFLEKRYRDDRYTGGQIDELRSLRLVPQYQIKVETRALSEP